MEGKDRHCGKRVKEVVQNESYVPKVAKTDIVVGK